jgi:undecaprenyl-diphosphatase
VHRPLLVVAALAALAVAGLWVLVKINPFIQVDDSLDRAIQSVSWGPIAAAFPFFSWVGGPGGAIYMVTGAIVLVILLNRRAWLFALAAAAGGSWYPIIVNLVNRPRPTVAQVLHITEHPGSTSFPSGHIIFTTISMGMVMIAVGHRYLPRSARPIAWAVAVAVILVAGVSRVYVGAHWPIDVLAGILIASGWLAFVTSIRWISDRALYEDAQ